MLKGMLAEPGKRTWHRDAAVFVSAIIGIAAVVAIFTFASPGTAPHGGLTSMAAP